MVCLESVLALWPLRLVDGLSQRGKLTTILTGLASASTPKVLLDGERRYVEPPVEERSPATELQGIIDFNRQIEPNISNFEDFRCAWP